MHAEWTGTRSSIIEGHHAAVRVDAVPDRASSTLDGRNDGPLAAVPVAAPNRVFSNV